MHFFELFLNKKRKTEKFSGREIKREREGKREKEREGGKERKRERGEKRERERKRKRK